MSRDLPQALPNMQQQIDVAIYASIAPSKTPDTSTPARQAAVNFENSIRANPVETGAFFNANGIVITQKSGTIDRIEFDPYELVGTTRSLFTHNHPSGKSFSVQDFEMAIDGDLIEMRVVTTYCRYIVKPKGAWPTFSKIEQAVQQHAPAVLQQVSALVQSCQLANGDLDKELQHRTWILVSNDLNFHYEREPS